MSSEGSDANGALAPIEAVDPATGARLGTVEVAAPEDVGMIVAGVAKVQPLWALLRVADRARYMRRVAQAIIDEFEELVELIAREQGRPRAEVATLELLAALDALIWIADEGARVLGRRPVAVHRSIALTKSARLVYEPFGVVGVIGAGSAPFAQPLGQIAGALLAGNGVVFKPARRACLAGERIARLLTRAGLPEGLVALAHGDSRVGVALAGSQLDKVLFTGSPAVGREVAITCASQDKEVTVERGGKDAMIVLADAHLGRAVDGALWAGYAGAGQARGSVERVYVAREVAERFVGALVERAGALLIGDPADPRVQVGPLGSRRRLAHVRELVEDALVQGAQLRCGGPLERQPAGCEGAFYRPAVITGVNHGMRLMREPVAGPVLTVMPVGSAGEAIALANDCEHGLGASVWTADRRHGVRVARRLEAGMVWINDHLPAPMFARGPWGASAGAGLGRTLGEAGLRACAQEKLITWDPPGARGLWWAPQDATLELAAHTAACLRSVRDADRQWAWRHGARALLRAGARTMGRGVPR